MRSRSQLGIALLALAVVAVLATLAIGSKHGALVSGATGDPDLRITVGTVSLSVPPGSTVRDALRDAHVTVPRGDLLDVLGGVLQPDRVSGHIEIAGTPVPMTHLVSDGDELAIVPGEDRTEPTVRRREQLDGRRPEDPQFTLSTWHLTRIQVMGRISEIVLSTRFVTIGRPETPNAIALTFDDGPNPKYTPRILRVLDALDVPATFFTVGSLVEEFPSLVRREARLGMTVANHSWDHPLSPAFKDLDRERAVAEMQRANRELASLGITATLFRPPGGTYDPELIAMAEGAGMRIALWDIDPRDWATGARPAEIARNVLENLRPGAIVELHDGGGDRSATVAALPRIIRGIRRAGYDVVAL